MTAPASPLLKAGGLDLSASIMCAHLVELGAELEKLDEAGIDSFHFDIMDGHFVPNLALTPAILAALRPSTRRPFVAHLMVADPRSYISPVADAGADVFVFHIEACAYPRRMLRDVVSAGMLPGVAINPATSVGALESVADAACVLVMSVEPGFAGADWVSTSPVRVRQVRAAMPQATIIVDGHIDLHTSVPLRAAGADMFVGGTKSIFSGDHTAASYREKIRAMRDCLATTSRP